MQPVETFFRLLFGPRAQGNICIATLTPTGEFTEYFFEYPLQLNLMLEKVQEYSEIRNVYFCPQILAGRKRSRAGVKLATNVWADLDECNPNLMLVKPSIVVESSPGRWQAFWTLEEPVEPDVAELVSKRIAYYHAQDGADKSGWDLSQLLRVPFTRNFNHGDAKPVKLLDIERRLYRPTDFKQYPDIRQLDPSHMDMPAIPDMTGEDVLAKYVNTLPEQLEFLFRDVPEDDSQGKSTWSEQLWQLELMGFEAGLSAIEVFILARDSACNKFARDNKAGHEELLWRDICRSKAQVQERTTLTREKKEELAIDLLSAEEVRLVSTKTTFIQEYIKWAKGLGDAAEQYHQAGALVLLSSLIAGSVRLPTSFGTIKPNLWFMILADTTLTRKSTAMDIAMELLEEVDSSAILATDGSIEGLMGSLAGRPGKPSIFLRDEFSGLLESITKKDYYAGMAETLTKLYDGKLQKRVLKKEVVEVKDPCLILFAGGIKNKVCQLLTFEHVGSGFLPRFVFITAESDVARVKPVGPPSVKDTTGRQRILNALHKLHAHYFTEQKLTQDPVTNRLTIAAPRQWDVELTPEAWIRYNKLESDMMRVALNTEMPDLMTPMYDRMCKSALKTAMLIAAAEQLVDPGRPIVIDVDTLLVAISYLIEWREHANLIVRDIGVSRDEKLVRNALLHITKNPGRTRSLLMQVLHLNARTTDQILVTLEQRYQIRRDKKQGGERLYPILPEKVNA